MTFNYLKGKKILPEEMDFEKATGLTEEGEKEVRAKIRASETASYLGIHLFPHRGFMRDDITAQRCGFQKNADGNYVLKTAGSVEK